MPPSITAEEDSSFLLPARNSDKAPRFDRSRPGTMRQYIKDYELLAAKARLSLSSKIQRFSMYMDTRDEDYIATFKEYKDADDWEKFIEAIYKRYPGTKGTDDYTMDDVNAIRDSQRIKTIITKADIADFDQNFEPIASVLLDQGIASETEINRAYWEGIDPAFRERLRFRLELCHQDHPRRKPWPRSLVLEEAMKLLENAPSGVQLPVRAQSQSVPPPVKSESLNIDDLVTKMTLAISHSLESSFAALNNNLQATQMINRNRERPFPPCAYNPPAQQGPPGPARPGDGIYYGPVGSIPREGCWMCSGSHRMLSCDVYRQYQQEGKVRWYDGRYYLADGNEVPNGPRGSTWKQRIDEYYVRNPQALPQAGPPSQTSNSQNNVQANFVSVYTLPSVETPEDDLEQELCTLRSQINVFIQEATTAPLEERPAIETTINVLNARLGKKEEAFKARSKCKGRANGPAQEPSTLQPTGAIPFIDVPSISKEKQPKPPPAVNVPPPMNRQANIPQYRYRAPVESEEAHKKVYEKILEQTVVMTIEECIATMPTVRKYFKDATTCRRVLTEEDKGVGLVEIQPTGTVSNYALAVEDQTLLEAKHSLPLRCLELTLNDSVKTEGILDTGCQVILMRKDVWSQLRVPLQSEKVLTMESANGTRNSTTGLIPRVKISIGSVSLICPVQVIENAPFAMLLGRPFMALGQAVTRDYYDGNMEITITDPNTGEIITVPTHARNGPNENKENPTNPSVPAASGFH